MSNVVNPFPRKLNHQIWEEYLKRKLRQDEIFIIEMARNENNYNKHITNLHNKAEKRGLYIPKLTGLEGNCLFESLEILGFGDSKSIRASVAHLMYLFKDHTYIFPLNNDQRSLQERFKDTNEITSVFCKKENIFYKYEFGEMCQDLTGDFSWTRLPTQLIITVMSLFFDADFEIISNLDEENYVTIIKARDDNTQKIYLGHIGESHYIPLCKKIDGLTKPAPQYNTHIKKFFIWGSAMERSINAIMKSIDSQISKKKTEDIYVDISGQIKTDNKNRVNYEQEEK